MKKIIIFALSLAFSALTFAQTPLRLPTILSDHAVIQQDADVKIELTDIILGEVWLASGQSNMEFAFRDYDRSALDVGDEVQNARNNELRFFRIDHDYSVFLQEHLSSGKWEVCTPETADKMSIIAYYFGKTVNEKVGAPVGMIASYWGGSSVQARMPAESYARNRELKAKAEDLTPVNWCPTTPSSLYNSMIYPLKNYRIAGTIWYQGETNTEHPDTYSELFSMLIRSWWREFDTEFPFYFVQIAPWNGYWQTSGALLREQQELTLAVPKTGMISVGDLVNDITDIHPRIKRQVGMRLVNLALSEYYGISGLQPYFSKFDKMQIMKNKAIISVKSYSKLAYKGKEISGFQICGADGNFVGGSQPSNGANGSPTDVSERTLREVFFPPFRQSVDAGAMSLMTAHNELNSVPCHENEWLMTDVLRGEWGFKGFVVSDWMDIEHIYDLHATAENLKEAFCQSIMAGMDMQSSKDEDLLKETITVK
ncbi:MAG: hypothetical protein LBG96_16400 [Tannerella sp.]|jgi:sialate O-acetylesterase|nr:hypothetical protein [Tannerella sp.]